MGGLYEFLYPLKNALFLYFRLIATVCLHPCELLKDVSG